MKQIKKILIGIGFALVSLTTIAQSNNTFKTTNLNVKDSLGFSSNILFIENADSLYGMFNTTKVWSMKDDSATFFVPFISNDTLRLPYAADAYGNNEQNVLMSRTNGLFCDSISNAGDAFRTPLIDFEKWLADTSLIEGKPEGKWMYPGDNEQYGIWKDARPSDINYSHRHMIEKLIMDNVRINKELERTKEYAKVYKKNISRQNIYLLILTLILFGLAIYLIKKE